MDAWKDIGEVDYDPFAGEPTGDSPAGGAPAAVPEPPAAVEAPAVVIPPAPAIPVVKFAEPEKPKPAEVKPNYKDVRPVDFDPFEQGSFIPEVAKGVAAGAVETTGGMLKGAGGQRQQVMADERARQYRQKWLADNGYGDRIVEIATLPVQQQEALRAGMTAARDQATREMKLEDDIFYKWGVDTTKWSEDKFKAAHDYENSFTRQLSEGFGSIAPYIAVNFVPGVGQAAALEAGYASSIGSQIDDAIAHGATKQQLLDAMRVGGVGGLTEQIPMEVLFERIPMPAMGKVLGAIAKVASTAFAEGSQEAAQQAIQNIVANYNYDPKRDITEGVGQAALIGALVGGGVATPGAVLKKNDEETEKKADDTPEVSSETQPEGTPAPAVDANAVPSTPGGTQAGTAPPPAGTEKQPVAPPDPATQTPTQPDPAGQPAPAKPAAVPAAAGGVIVVQPGATDPSIGAALGGGQPAAQPEQALPDIADEDLATDADLSAQEHRIRDMLSRQNEQAAQQTTAAPHNADISAALAATAPQPTTVGQQQTPPPTVENPLSQVQATPAAQPAAPQPVTGENLGTGQALQPAPPAATLVEPAAQPVSQPGPPTPVVGTQEPVLPPPAPAPIPAATQEPLPAAPAPPAEQLPADAAPPQEVAAFGTAAPAPAPRVAGKLTLAPGEKGARFKKQKAEPVAAAPALATTREKAAEAVQPQPSHETAPAPAPVAQKATRTNLSRDTAEHARDLPEMQRSTVSELPEFRETLHDVAAEHVAEHPRAKDQSPGDYIRKHAPQLIAKVKERLAAAEEEKAQADIAAKELLTSYGRKKAAKATAKEERKAEMAAADTGQKKERAGKIKGKSAEGIRGEKEKATQSAYAEEQKKPEAERDSSLMEWGRLDAEQRALPKAGKIKQGPHAGRPVSEVRAEIKERKAQLQEDRALDAEAREQEGPGLAPRAKEAERATSDAIDKVDMPDESGSATRQVADVNRHFDEIDKATKGIPVAGRIDTKHNSPAENLVIYARKVAANLKRNLAKNRGAGEEGYQGIGPVDFAVARKLYENGQIDQLNDMIVSQQLKGGGYSEHQGKGERQAWTEEEASVREHETEEGYELPDEQPKLGPVREAGEPSGVRDFRPVTVTRPSGGEVTVTAETHKASSLLKDLGKKLDKQGGNKFWAILRRAHIRHLTQLVGDVDVHFVTGADMEKLAGQKNADGLYFNYSNTKRYQGFRPQVFIDTSVTADPASYAHTLIHEMTHAATSQAITDDVRGTFRIIDTMRKDLQAQLQDIGIGVYELRMAGVNYGFTNPHEFIAEAFSNERFQKILAQLPVSAKLRREIGAIGRGKLTWWDTVVAAVSNAIGMVGGNRGHTYMEQVMSLSPHLLRSSEQQEQAAMDSVFGGNEQPLPRAVASGPLDEQMLTRQFNGQLQGFMDKLSDMRHGGVTAGTAGGLKNTWATTGQLRRYAEDVFGGARNAFDKLAELSTKRDAIHDRYRASHGWVKMDATTGQWVTAKANEAGAEQIDNNAVEKQNFELKRKSLGKHHQLSKWMDDATRAQVNGSVPLSHVDNKDVSKSGSRSQDQRAWHADLAARFASAEPDVKAAIKANIKHYQQTRAIENDADIRYGLTQAVKAYRKQLPPGKTIDDVVAWVRSGAAARDVANQTQEDKDYHAALGNTVKTLAEVNAASNIKGVYAPMQRKGKYFISAREKYFGTLHSPANLPAGAIPAATPNALKKDGPDAIIDRLMFPSRADYDAFVDNHPGQVHGGTMHVDPKTGQKVPSVFSVADPSVPGGIRSAQKLFVATVQNNRMEMSDSRSKLQRRANELQGQGHKVAAIRLSRTELHQVAEEISPLQFKALLKNLEQTTAGHGTASQAAIKGALLDAQVRTLNRPSHLDRNLKRRNVLGNDIDAAMAMRDYNRGLARKLANYDIAPAMAEADQALQDTMDAEANRQYNDDRTLAQQRLASELRHRIKDMEYTSGPKWLKAVKDITAWRTLASPHNWIINSMQPSMMTMPVLSAEYGDGVAWREMMKVLQLGGVSRTLGHGFGEMWTKAKHLIPGSADPDAYSHDGFWRRITAGESDAALLHRGFQEMNDSGYGAAGGIELGRSSEADMNRAEVVLHRWGDMWRQIPESIEVNNRYATLVAALRLAKLKGLSDDLAVRKAVLTVEQTQGGYAAANNPVIFSKPWAAPAAQFKKYSLAFGQLYYNSVSGMVGHDPVQRKIARKTFARLSLMSVAMAGIYGLPLIELGRMAMMIAGLLGLTDKDWDDVEAGVQGWMAGMLKATGAGAEISEAMFHGASRLAGLDLANNMSNSNLLTFDGPKSYELDDLKVWVFDQLSGATGGMLGSMYKAYQSGDPLDAIPWPRLVKNINDAYEVMTKGKVDPKTGEKYMDPVGAVQTGWKSLGFKTADEARQWEAGGSAYENKVEKRERGERRTLMEKWSYADPATQRELRQGPIADWNATHKGDMKITIGNLMQSRNTRKREQKKREKERGLQ